MPTIEIVSIGADKLGLKQTDFDIAFIEENKLISHRGLFYDFLKKQNGVIVHIGNPDLKNDKECGFFAGLTIDFDFIDKDYRKNKKGLRTSARNHYANQTFRFKIKAEYFTEIKKIIEISLNCSPPCSAFFLTDYQFGPEIARTEKVITLEQFSEKHNIAGLDWNTLYKLTK
jgi:hypothetical protein